MARTTVGAVQAILLKDYDTIDTPTLQAFIESATALVDRVEECAEDRDDPRTAAELELIERWLAAHFYAVSDRPYTSKSTQGASASFQGQTGKYLEFTGYGQMAVALDTSGCLAAITTGEAGRQAAGMEWLGKNPSTQIDYVDRD